VRVGAGACEFCGKAGDFHEHGPRICRECYLAWIRNGKPYCSVCGTEVLDLKKHIQENKDDRHLILEVMAL
jgi:hypothetical protein